MLIVTETSTGYRVDGHAEYAERGTDIVCASVSAITQTIAFTLADLNQGEYTQEDGHLLVNIWYQSLPSQTLMNALRTGVEAIAEQYPENVSYKRRD